ILMPIDELFDIRKQVRKYLCRYQLEAIGFRHVISSLGIREDDRRNDQGGRSGPIYSMDNAFPVICRESATHIFAFGRRYRDAWKQAEDLTTFVFYLLYTAKPRYD